MRILILNQFFYPDAAATSQLLTDLVRGLAEEGHAVRVICGRRTYAGAGLAFPSDPPRAEVVRTAGTPFALTRLKRVTSYLSYLSGAALHSLLGPRPDLILTLTSPPGLSAIGALVKFLGRARHFIWEMDVYPDIAVDLGVIGARSWVTRLVGFWLDAARRNADGIIVLSQTMRTRLVQRGMPAERLHIAENWADGREIQPEPFPAWDPLTILYSGNLGLAHDVETVSEAILRFSSDSRFHFAFAGAGSGHNFLRALCAAHAISNISLRDYCDRGGLSHSLSTCHIGLVTQKPATLGAVVPSKTYGIMAAGRPVLYIGPKEGTPAQIIARFRCGWQIDSGDGAALSRLLERLATNPGEIAEAGARAREAFLRNYDRPRAVARICSILALQQLEGVEAVTLSKEQIR